MRPRLAIRLPSAEADTLRWVSLDDQGRPEGDSGSGGWSEAAAASAGREVIGLAPALDVLLLSAQIPTQSRQRLVQALPFALEDQLAQDVEALHFTAGPRDATGATWVAVVERMTLARWLDAAREAGFELDQVVPELSLVPVAPGGWSLLVEHGDFLLRTGHHGGFAGDPDNLDTLLELALSEAGDDAPQALHVYEAAPLPVPLELPGLEVSREPVADATALLAGQLPARPAFALRHGPFARVRSASVQWRRWRPVAVLAVVALALDLGLAGVGQWRLEARSEQLQERIEEQFRRAFPGSDRIIDPRSQMESRLRALRRGGDSGPGSGFLELVGRVGPTLSSAGDLQIAALAYRDGDLELEVSAGNLQQVDQLKQRLEGLGGLRVEVRSARSEGDRVQGRLQISAAAPTAGGGGRA